MSEFSLMKGKVNLRMLYCFSTLKCQQYVPDWLYTFYLILFNTPNTILKNFGPKLLVIAQ